MGDIRIPVTDLGAIHSKIREEIAAAIDEILSSSRFILGPPVADFEKEMAGYVDTEHAIGVASGTDALAIALQACGVGPGDEVITTPFSFIASSECIVRCGAKPVFADIDPQTYNIDPAQIEEKITPKTVAVLPVHLYGRPAEIEAIMDIAERHDLKVVEDCAQALGAEYKGQRVGSFGVAGCLSFFPAKILGALGDGGMITTNDAEVAQRCRTIRAHGGRVKYHYEVHGLNSRLDALQAAVLSVKLKHVDGWIDQRISIAGEYEKVLGSLPMELPRTADNFRHVFNYYTIAVPDRRDELHKHLAESGVGSAIYYPLSLHLQEAYSYLGYKRGDFPNSEKAEGEVLSLPMYPGMKKEDVEGVAEAVMTFLV